MELLDLIEAYYSPAKPKSAETSRPDSTAPSLDLDLPVWDDRETRRTPVSPEALILRSEAFLAYRNGRAGAAMDRLEKKCRVEFQM